MVLLPFRHKGSALPLGWRGDQVIRCGGDYCRLAHEGSDDGGVLSIRNALVGLGLAPRGVGHPGGRHRVRSRLRASHRCRRRDDRDRVRGRLPCRNHRPPRGRTVRHARAGGGGDGHRGGADRLHHGGWRTGEGRPAARHGVRRRHDHLQRPGRHLPAGRRGPPSRAGVPAPGRARRAGRPRRPDDADPGAAQRRHERARTHLLQRPARLFRRGVARALRQLRLRPDRPPPRLFPAAGRRSEDDHAAGAVGPDGMGQPASCSSRRWPPSSAWPRL